MQAVLQQVVQGRNLTEAQMVSAFDKIMNGEATPAQLGALLTALRMKGETVDELSGACQSMRRHAVLVDPRGRKVVDTCGTGGDGLGTFNISTTAAFVVAGAGVPVAKHGNRSITSRCGSADVLAQLGVNLDAAPEVMEECLQEVGIAFLFAPKLHPAMKHAMGPRRELGVRTVFNMLGPLTNPSGAKAQIIGVFAPELTEPFAEVLRLLGSRRAFVVHGHDGMDEITTTTTTRVSELVNGAVKTYELDAQDFVGDHAALKDLAGGTPAENAATTRRVLDGAPGPCRDIACLNAAAAIVAGGGAQTLRQGWDLAAEAVASGRARKALEDLVRISQAG